MVDFIIWDRYFVLMPAHMEGDQLYHLFIAVKAQR